MTDPEGVSYSVNDPVYYDDGHSADWVHGTVVSFLPNKVSIRPESGPNIPVLVDPPLVHVNKPPHPPDRE